MLKATADPSPELADKHLHSLSSTGENTWHPSQLPLSIDGHWNDLELALSTSTFDVTGALFERSGTPTKSTYVQGVDYAQAENTPISTCTATWPRLSADDAPLRRLRVAYGNQLDFTYAEGVRFMSKLFAESGNHVENRLSTPTLIVIAGGLHWLHLGSSRMVGPEELDAFPDKLRAFLAATHAEAPGVPVFLSTVHSLGWHDGSLWSANGKHREQIALSETNPAAFCAPWLSHTERSGSKLRGGAKAEIEDCMLHSMTDQGARSINAQAAAVLHEWRAMGGGRVSRVLDAFAITYHGFKYTADGRHYFELAPAEVLSIFSCRSSLSLSPDSF